MRFLVDECTGPKVARWLQGEGYEVLSVYHEAPGTDDDVLLDRAAQENWVIVTNDRDFGEKIFRERRAHRGVVFLRLTDERAANKIAVLRQVLAQYIDRIENNFLVVTENKVRIV
jgi:predicted nuclease of predicted toxin-antitoxin system